MATNPSIMNRRRFLALAGTAGSLSLGGCVGAGPPGAGSPTTDPETVSPPSTITTTPTPDHGPEVSFAVVDRTCGSGADDAEIAFSADAVRVDGVIGGRDTCDTAELDGVDLDDGTLTVRVATALDPDSGGACAQCLTDIRYEATARFEGDLPDRVEVIHEGIGGRETVATATR